MIALNTDLIVELYRSKANFRQLASDPIIATAENKLCGTEFIHFHYDNVVNTWYYTGELCAIATAVAEITITNDNFSVDLPFSVPKARNSCVQMVKLAWQNAQETLVSL